MMTSLTTELLKGASFACYNAFKNDDISFIADFIRDNNLSLDEWKRLYDLNHNRYKRVQRLKMKVADLVLNGDAIFLTLTFTDDVLNSTSVETRRRYVSRFLKSQCKTYVANIDFGFKNGREHYHAIVNPIAPLIDLQSWSYGALNAKRIHASDTDLTRTTKYITKLTSHAIKETTGHAYRIIYSR